MSVMAAQLQNQNNKGGGKPAACLEPCTQESERKRDETTEDPGDALTKFQDAPTKFQDAPTS
jgi:hypothetical protein